MGPIGAELGDGLGGTCPKIFSQIFEQVPTAMGSYFWDGRLISVRCFRFLVCLGVVVCVWVVVFLSFEGLYIINFSFSG